MSGKTSLIHRLRNQGMLPSNIQEHRESDNLTRLPMGYAEAYDTYGVTNITRWLRQSVLNSANALQPIIVESSFLVDPKIRMLYAGLATRSHEVISCTVFIPENIRKNNRVESKYYNRTDLYLQDVARRGNTKQEGFRTRTPRELIEYLDERGN